MNGQDLEDGLLEIDQNFIWIHSIHDKGSGGIAMGLNPKWGYNIKDIPIGMRNMWVAFEKIMVLIGVYALALRHIALKFGKLLIRNTTNHLF